MAVQKKRRKVHRGRRKKTSIVSNIILVAALAVFAVSAFKIFGIVKGYKEGQDEYEEVQELAVAASEDGGEGVRIDFDELKAVNPDTVAWLRFHPQPEIINYPVVKGADNDEYLHKTFNGNANDAGTIFLDVNNSGDFSDTKSILYGHRMDDGSMFRKLEEYKKREFWEANPYFYIYTPDGFEFVYRICFSGTISAMDPIYKKDYISPEEYQACLDALWQKADYDRGITVGTGDDVVILSTCTSANDDNRYIVMGILESTIPL